VLTIALTLLAREMSALGRRLPVVLARCRYLLVLIQY